MGLKMNARKFWIGITLCTLGANFQPSPVGATGFTDFLQTHKKKLLGIAAIAAALYATKNLWWNTSSLNLESFTEAELRTEQSHTQDRIRILECEIANKELDKERVIVSGLFKEFRNKLQTCMAIKYLNEQRGGKLQNEFDHCTTEGALIGESIVKHQNARDQLFQNQQDMGCDTL